jgi:hypothetical protein
MLADSHFLASPAFLGWAGVVIAVATLAVIVTQLVTGSPRRVLTYALVSDTALLSVGAREKAGPDLRVTLGSDLLDDPHVVSARIEYKGRRDIRTTDFEGSRPLSLDVGVPILQRFGQGDAEELPVITVAPGARQVEIGPGLIKKGQLISIDLLTDGPVQLKCISPLADVMIREAQVDDESDFIWVKRMQAACFTLFGVGLFGLVVAEQTPFYFVLTIFLFGVLGFTTWIARAMHSAWKRRGQLKVTGAMESHIA